MRGYLTDYLSWDRMGIEGVFEMPDDPLSRSYSRSIPIPALREDPAFAGLFLQEKETIAGIAADMKKHGFDPHRPIDVWRDARGRGRHVVLEGHQRLAAARKAGLTEVYVAYREPANRLEALLWAAQQQGLRRNV